MKFYKDITNRWKRELEEAFEDNPDQRVVLMSPYITYPDVLRAFPSSSCEVYTVFSAENFINGSSSAQALKKIHELGCKLYHLPNLHAKILAIPDQFASVGSQNLTYGSRKNLEASAIFRDSVKVDKIWNKVEAWTDDREEVTLEMIEDILEKIKSLREIFKKEIEQKSKKIDASVREKAAIKNKGKVREKPGLWRQQLVRTINESPQSEQVKRGEVITRSNEESDIFQISSLGHLIKWTIDGIQQSLTRLNRYLCILEGTGKMGWGRIGDTRISRFSRRVNRTDESLRINSIPCKLSYSFIWNNERLNKGENLDITIEPVHGNFSITLKTGFLIKKLEPIDIISSSNEGISLRNFISGHFKEVSKKILRHMLEPFTYKEGHKLEGGGAIRATEFLGNRGSQFRVRLHKIEENPILVFSGPL